MPDIVVTDDADKGRFEAHQGAVLVGFAEYQLTDDLYVFTHTQVDPAHEGQGVGGALARGALDRVREDGTRQVLAVCPFIESWMSRHPDYADLNLRAAKSTPTD
jgi:predicted GNAT family acetyltransferase